MSPFYISRLWLQWNKHGPLFSIIHVFQFAISQINLQFPKLISSYFLLLGHLFKSLALIWLSFLNLKDYCWLLNKFVSVVFSSICQPELLLCFLITVLVFMTILDSADYLSFKICPLLRKKKVGQSATVKMIIKNKI